MPLNKLSEIEKKLRKDYIDIKKRYTKLKSCKYTLLILKTNLLSWMNLEKLNHGCRLSHPKRVNRCLYGLIV